MNYFTIKNTYYFTNIFFYFDSCDLMSNLAKLEFAALDISGKNYLSWVLDAEIHLDAKGLGNIILVDKGKSNDFHPSSSI